MLNSDRIVGLTRTRSIRCYGCGEAGVSNLRVLVASFKVSVDDAWFRVSPRPRPLSLSLSLSSGLRAVVCLLLICPAVKKFVLFGFLCFFTMKVTDWPKSYFYFNFFDKFHRHFAMH